MITVKEPRKKSYKEAKDNNVWFNDIECFPNYFLAVFENRDTGVLTIIEIHDKDNGDLARFLDSKPYLIGYNIIGYDAQVLEYILRNPGVTVEEIKAFSDKVITTRGYVYPPYSFSLRCLDIMEVNNYGRFSAKATSLKYLSFFFRFPSVKDSPYPFNQKLTDRQKLDVISYCVKDCSITRTIYDESLELIKMRHQLGTAEGLDLINSPEPRLAKAYFINEISKRTGKSIHEIKNQSTYRSKIVVKDIIFPYINFKTDEFKSIKSFYEGIVLTASVQSKINPANKCIVLKESIGKKIEINGTEFDYKAGGIHGCYKKGVYSSDKDMVIVDLDYTSFYPKLAILNKFSPAHIDVDVFCNILENLFQKRISYDKKTHFTLNYAYKILINIVYGLSNQEFGPFYDAEYTLKTCVNGMLIISMLMEEVLLRIKNSIILQANTDGVTLLMPRSSLDELDLIIKENEKFVGLEIEKSFFDKMIIYDVNNYMALAGDKVKQKGLFTTRETMYKEGSFHKDTSMNIIPIALSEYFLNGKSPRETLEGCNDIHEFIGGVKGTRRFKWLISTKESSGVIKSELSDDRVLRYYVGGDSSISKMWLKDKDDLGNPIPSGFTLINASKPVTSCQSIRNHRIKIKSKLGDKNNYPDLDLNYYEEEVWKIIREIES